MSRVADLSETKYPTLVLVELHVYFIRSAVYHFKVLLQGNAVLLSCNATFEPGVVRKAGDGGAAGEVQPNQRDVDHEENGTYHSALRYTRDDRSLSGKRSIHTH